MAATWATTAPSMASMAGEKAENIFWTWPLEPPLGISGKLIPQESSILA